MNVLGITGGIGSGKSAVLAFLEMEYGARVYRLDEVAKVLQESGSLCFEQIVAVFGQDILGADGELDRAGLSEIVFANPDKLIILNEIVHPRVREWVSHSITEQREKGTALYVLEAALLIEADYGEICDEMWYIYADEVIRTERLKRSRGYSDEKIAGIMATQASDAVFRQACTVVIDNGRDFEYTKKQIKERLGERI